MREEIFWLKLWSPATSILSGEDRRAGVFRKCVTFFKRVSVLDKKRQKRTLSVCFIQILTKEILERTQ